MGMERLYAYYIRPPGNPVVPRTRAHVRRVVVGIRVKKMIFYVLLVLWLTIINYGIFFESAIRKEQKNGLVNLGSAALTTCVLIFVLTM